MNLALPLIQLHQFFHPPMGTAARRVPSQVHEIAKRAIVDLGDASGRTITCLDGALWLTHDNDCRDVVLQRDETHTVDRGSRLLIQALEDATVRVTLAPGNPCSAAVVCG